MNVFDLNSMKSFPYEQRDKNVFYWTPDFKARIVELPPGGKMPECQMESYVVFTVIEGTAMVVVNQQATRLHAGQCFITEPATLSMTTDSGVKIVGLQIIKNRE